MNRPKLDINSLRSGETYKYVIHLYEEVASKYEDSKFNKISLLLYFSKEVAGQIEINQDYNCSIEYCWLKLCKHTNFEDFINCAENYLKVN
jgi:hypothetical protein